MHDSCFSQVRCGRCRSVQPHPQDPPTHPAMSESADVRKWFNVVDHALLSLAVHRADCEALTFSWLAICCAAHRFHLAARPARPARPGPGRGTSAGIIVVKSSGNATRCIGATAS